MGIKTGPGRAWEDPPLFSIILSKRSKQSLQPHGSIDEPTRGPALILNHEGD